MPQATPQLELIGQSLELWRPPLASALARRDTAPLGASAGRQLAAGVTTIDVNGGAGARAADLRWAAAALHAALPRIRLFLDGGDASALSDALRGLDGAAVSGGASASGGALLIANAVPLGPGDDARRVIDAAASAAAGVVLSPRLADASRVASVDELSALIDVGLHMTAAAGVTGPVYADALAFPPTSDRVRCLRSLALLRALAGSPGARPLVAAGNAGHGAPARLRPALRRCYAALAAGAGAQALILPAEDAALMRTLGALRGATAPTGAADRWLAAVASSASIAAAPPPPADAGEELREAWAILAGLT